MDMAEEETRGVYLEKAQQSLAGAESEFIHGLYDNTANRCYYACFQAAIAALLREGIESRNGQWGHDYVPAEFSGNLVNRRHLYPPNLRGVLERNYILRQTAGYEDDHVSRTRAGRALERTRVVVGSVREKGA